MIPNESLAGATLARPLRSYYLTSEEQARLRRENIARLDKLAVEQRLQPQQPQRREWKVWR